MITQYFNIQNLADDSLMVTILTTSMTSDYWDSLEALLSEMDASNKTVYFDFMVRNGLMDRFYKSQTDETSKLTGELHKCTTSKNVLLSADTFFSEHKIYIERSVLTRSQKINFARRLMMM